jgi:hypothetical protein
MRQRSTGSAGPEGATAAARRVVFPGLKVGKPLSSMALEMVLRRADVDATVHGFRSLFRDWAGERTAFPREIAEAYRRGDALEKRRDLMDAWTSSCAGTVGANLVPLRA